ncbi:unnamed protein product [Rhizophagus irregularis]|nr:unnamed protein product [Rhizophagus irregularis]
MILYFKLRVFWKLYINQKISSQNGIFISPVFATSSYQAWFLHIDLSYQEAHCLSHCNYAFSCFLSVSVVPYSSTLYSIVDGIEQSDENQCRVSIFFQTDCFGEDLAVESQMVEVSKLRHFGISFKNICSRRSRRLGYLFDNVPTAPNIIFCIKGRYLYAHSEIIENATTKFKEMLKIGKPHQQKENDTNEKNSKRFIQLLNVGLYLKDIRDESIIFIAKNFPLIQSTIGFKKFILNLNQYPGARDIWLEITNTIKRLGYSNYLSVPLFKNIQEIFIVVL